ncbi:MAG TPA: alpha/beta fold hydrolase [Thermoanaerobaculia bacterium]|nr:alpha/beta fold hydrolase [Thermoanaerobaculia bacterium]
MGRTRAEDHPGPLARLLRFPATDGVELPALLYEPRRATNRAAVFLHGTGGSSVFDSRRTNRLAEEFLSRGIAYFAFNNRGAHVVRRIGMGSAFERIRDCVKDIDGALRELRQRGYRDVTLIGHSTGANKIAVYDHYKPRNAVKRYVLLAGGDDTGMLYDHLGPRRFRAALAKARDMIKAKRGDEFVPRALSPMLLTWRAFYDTANPDGDYNVFPFLEALQDIRLSRRARFRYVKAIRKPALFLYGEHDEYSSPDTSTCVRVLAGAIGARPNVELAIIAGADHGFGGMERELVDVIMAWIESPLSIAAKR